MHRATTTLGRIQTGAEPFKIGAFTAVHLDAQKASGRKLKRVFRAALDGFGQLFGRDLAKREVNFGEVLAVEDRKSTRLNSSHTVISYAVFCLKKKNKEVRETRRS